MRLKFGTLLFSVALLVTCLTAWAGQTPPDTFTFLHITDTHQTAKGDTAPLRRLADEAAAMSPRPAFVIDTGDVTEAGRPAEFDAFKAAIAPLEAAGVKFYAVPGNHDVRWSADGKRGFEKTFGKVYQSFDYGGAHFILLDSTVLLEHFGHIDAAQLKWLENDLKRVKPQTPVMIFLHHPVGRDTPGVRMLDNEYDFWPLLREKNVVAVFTGHGHADLKWEINGITCVMARGLYQGSYHRVSVSRQFITIERVVRDPNNDGPDKVAPVAKLPVLLGPRSVLKARFLDPGVAFLVRRRPAAQLDPRAPDDKVEGERGEYRVNDGEWLPLKKNDRDIWQTEFRTEKMPVGVHMAGIRILGTSGTEYRRELIFEVERGYDEPNQQWAVNLDGPIQSSPLLFEKTLAVSGLDGKIYGLNTENGKRRWTFTTKGQFTASPVLSDGTLYIGGTDGFLYALEAASGRQRWRFDAGNPLFATAAVAQGVVCVGGNGAIYGVDVRTGKQVWTQPAGDFFQSRAATDGTNFYLGGWDNTLYALDARTGEPRWKVSMGRANDGKGALSFYYAPAIASPTVANGRVYAVTNDGILHALNALDGKEIWITRAPGGGDRFGYSSPVVSENVLYIAGMGDTKTGNGDVYALNTSDGSLMWRTKTGQIFYDATAKVAPDGRSLAIMGQRGRVSVLDAQNGKRLWGYELGPGHVFSAPEYDGRTVYTVTMANDVQALNAPGAVVPKYRQERGTAATPSGR